jgi:hypothetical protein
LWEWNGEGMKTKPTDRSLISARDERTSAMKNRRRKIKRNILNKKVT